MLTQEKFVLTSDMVPIHFPESQLVGYHFLCPLPQGYKEVVRSLNAKYLCEGIQRDINNKVFKIIPHIYYAGKLTKPDFKPQGKKALDHFSIGDVDYNDASGLLCVWSGDITANDRSFASLELDSEHSCEERLLDPLTVFFEESACLRAFDCKHYWQTLLLRQYCIEYFNALNRTI
jgi:hypothetical protein